MLARTLRYLIVFIIFVCTMIVICLFTIKLDVSLLCFVTFDNGSSNMVVNKSTYHYLETENIKYGKIEINHAQYSCYITFDEYIDSTYHYWLSIDTSLQLDNISFNTNCSFKKVSVFDYIKYFGFIK